MTERDPLSTPAVPGGLPFDASQIQFTQATVYAAGTLGAHAQAYVSVKDAPFNAVGDGVTDDTAAISAAITACLASGKALYAPAGTYLVTGQLTTIPGQFLLYGEGRQQTTFLFRPSVDNVACIKLSNGASQVLNVTLRDFGISSDDSTHIKIALDVYDLSTCDISNVYIHGTVNASPGGAVYFSGGTGSFGIRTHGREACRVSNLQVNADYPIYVAANPNSAATNCEDMDHWTWDGYLYLNPISQYAITVADGLGLQNTEFRNLASVGGLGAFKVNDTRVAPTVRSHNIAFRGFRGEQATASTGYWFNTAFATRCETFTIDDGEGDSTTQGFLSDRICNFNCIGVIFARSSGDSVKITSPDSDAVATFIGCQFQLGSSFTMTGYTASIIAAFNSTDFAGPATAVYVANTNQAGVSYTGGKVLAKGAAATSVIEGSANTGGDRFQVMPQVAGSGVQLRAVDDGVSAFKPMVMQCSYLGSLNKIYPGTDAGALQTASGLYAGTGVPNNANGANGDIYFRSDGGAGTTIYQRRAGAWVATGA